MPSQLTDNPTLPKKDEDICRMIDDHVAIEESKLQVRKIRWELAAAYAQGHRVFQFRGGGAIPRGLGAFHFNDDGKMPLQNSSLLKKANEFQGHLQSLDMRPTALREEVSLSGIRERGIAQVLANSALSVEQIEGAWSRFTWMFTWLGSCGIQGDVIDYPNVGLTSEISVIPPWEIFPFPSLNNDLEQVRGFVRQRLVPVDHLKDPSVYGKRFGSMMGKMSGHIFSRKVGSATDTSEVRESPTPRTFGQTNQMSSNRRSSGSKAQYKVAMHRELFLFGPRGTLQRMVSCVGNALLVDETYDSIQTYVPIAYERFMETGDFRGAGMFDLLFSLESQFEKLVESLVVNTRDQERYPVTVIPAGVMNEKSVFKDDGNRLRFVTVTPEESFGTNKDFRPITVSPHNSGDVPGRTAAFLREVIQENSPVRDLLKEKGRIDSLPALQFFDEREKRSVNTPVANSMRAWSTIYKYCVSQTANHLVRTPRALPLSDITVDLAGVVIDFDKGSVSFTENPLPDLSRIRFIPRSRGLKSEAVRKGEAVEMLKLQREINDMGDWDGFLLLTFEEGMDFALYAKGEKNAYDSVVMNILRLYNDGQTPGQIVLTPHTERPEFQLRILNDFMTSRTMSVASPQVIDGFKIYRETLLMFMGQILPQSVPDPYDAALLDQVRAAQMAQQAQGQLPAAPGSIDQPQQQPQLTATA